MNPIIKTILLFLLAAIVGLFLGGALNMAIIMLGPMFIPPPEGVDTSSVESIKEHIHLFETKHYVMPFLAHALGTLFGAFIAVKIGLKSKLSNNVNLLSAFVIGCFFLWGGITVNEQIGSPQNFMLFDVILAYIPMAWIGYKLGNKKKA